MQEKIPSYVWHFPFNSTLVALFKASEPDKFMHSDTFSIIDKGNEYSFRICCTPNGWSDHRDKPPRVCALWLSIESLPAGIDTLRATFRFVCDEVNYDVNRTIVNAASDRIWAVNDYLLLDEFTNLEEWTLRFYIDVHPVIMTRDRKTCYKFAQSILDGIQSILKFCDVI